MNCPTCQNPTFTVFRSEPIEVNLEAKRAYASTCESVTEINCKNCGFQFDAAIETDLWDAVCAVANDYDAPQIAIKQIVGIAPELIGGVALWPDANNAEKVHGCLLSPLLQPILATQTRRALDCEADALTLLLGAAYAWKLHHDEGRESDAIESALKETTLFANDTAREKS